mgnify:CR=1 FL=1
MIDTSDDEYEYRCPACNTIVSADDKICPKCGESLEEEQYENVPLSKESPAFFKFLLIVGVFVSLKSSLMHDAGGRNFVFYISRAAGSFAGLTLVSYLLGYIPVQLLRKKIKKARIIIYGIIFLLLSVVLLAQLKVVSLSEQHVECGLSYALLFLISIAAFKEGLLRFGKQVQIPLFAIFIFSWILSTLIFVFWQSIQRGIGLIILSVFLIGILFWLSSLVFGNRKK